MAIVNRNFWCKSFLGLFRAMLGFIVLFKDLFVARFELPRIGNQNFVQNFLVVTGIHNLIDLNLTVSAPGPVDENNSIT